MMRLGSPLARAATRAILVATLVWNAPVATHASPIGLRFIGITDLAAFGVSPESAVAGTVTWDRDQACGPGAGEGDFALSPLEDSAPCVAATLRINGVDYSSFDLELSRLMLFPDGLVVQLWFEPSADLDGADGTDVRLVELALWQPVGSQDPVFPDVGVLPADLAFLGRLTDRSLMLSAPTCFDPEGPCIQSSAQAVNVVPEASKATLLVIGLLAAGLSARRQQTPNDSPSRRRAPGPVASCCRTGVRRNE